MKKGKGHSSQWNSRDSELQKALDEIEVGIKAEHRVRGGVTEG